MALTKWEQAIYELVREYSGATKADTEGEDLPALVDECMGELARQAEPMATIGPAAFKAGWDGNEPLAEFVCARLAATVDAPVAEPVALTPFGWCLGHVSQGTDCEPGGEVNYDFVQGDDRPEGECWFPVYTEAQLEDLSPTVNFSALTEAVRQLRPSCVECGTGLSESETGIRTRLDDDGHPEKLCRSCALAEIGERLVQDSPHNSLAAPPAPQATSGALTMAEGIGKHGVVKQWPDVAASEPVADNWRQYATERENTAQQVVERHRQEHDSLLRLLANARKEQEHAYRCIQGMYHALTTETLFNQGYHAPTIGAAKRVVFEGALDGSEYFIGKPVDVLHAALALPEKGK